MTPWEALEESRAQLMETTAELRSLMVDAAEKEAAYQRAKRDRALEIRAEGVPWTGVQLIVKGDPDVNAAYLEREVAVATRDAAQEHVNTLKTDIRVITNQIQREYGQNMPY